MVTVETKPDGWHRVLIDGVGQAQFAPCALESAEHFAMCLRSRFPGLAPRGEGGYTPPDSGLIER